MTSPPPRPAADTVARLREIGLIPIVRVGSAEAALGVAEALVAAGVGVVEITLSVPGALDVISTIARRFGRRIVLGAGTVTDAEDVRRVVEAGAEFIVSPCVAPDVVAKAHALGVAAIPGALTPTEMFNAVTAGADLVKIFPIHSVGGPAYLRALLGPFPNTPLVPTGGVTLESIAGYFRAGAAAVGVGSELVPPDAVRRADYAAIGDLAVRFVNAVKEARPAGSRVSV